MPSRTRFEWNGDELVRRLAEASRASIDETLHETDDVATASHWWHRRTGLLERKIEIDPATISADGLHITGAVGVKVPPGAGRKGVRFNPFYGLFLEIKLPWLRPAADITFPRLAEKIRRRLNA